MADDDSAMLIEQSENVGETSPQSQVSFLSQTQEKTPAESSISATQRAALSHHLRRTFLQPGKTVNPADVEKLFKQAKGKVASKVTVPIIPSSPQKRPHKANDSEDGSRCSDDGETDWHQPRKVVKNSTQCNEEQNTQTNNRFSVLQNTSQATTFEYPPENVGRRTNAPSLAYGSAKSHRGQTTHAPMQLHVGP